VPENFDVRKPGVIVVFFHGNGATLARDVVDRQGVFRQISDSGVNAVLLAPQFAIDAADSSSGRFWEAGRFNQFLREGARRAAELYGNLNLRTNFERMPVILVAYSGGYNAAAFALAVGAASKRIKGVILLDALYAEEDKVADWIASARKSAFFFSAYTKSSAPNNDTLQQLLAARGVGFDTEPPSHLNAGEVTFFATDPDLVHDDFVTRAWVDDPVKWLLARVPGYPR